LVLFLEHGELGAVRTLKFPAQKGKPRMTAKEFVRSFPKGNFVLRQANHVVGVKDGVVVDKFDSTGRCVYQAFEISANASGNKKRASNDSRGRRGDDR
ncbi:MAG: hypothetical protein WBQ03_10400, partial [Candidatus Sulfotelmatobacter sp.]